MKAGWSLGKARRAEGQGLKFACSFPGVREEGDAEEREAQRDLRDGMPLKPRELRV